MKLKKTLALTMAAMAVCASAFAGVSVKSYDVNEDWVKMEVPQVKGAGADVDAKINNALSFNALMQLYSPLPQSDKSADAMLASFEQNFSGKDGVKEAHEFLEDVGGFVNYTLHTDWQAAKALGGSMVDSYGLEGKYDVLYSGEKLLCVEQQGYLFTGGAHGTTLYDVSTFDLTSGKELQLSDADTVYDLIKTWYPDQVAICRSNLPNKERKRNEKAFMRGERRIMVATSAFGMGINKSDVRLIIHYNLPLSLIDYYQQAGRAGRDGGKARCILLYNKSYYDLNRYVIEQNQEFRALDYVKTMNLLCTQHSRCLIKKIGYFLQPLTYNRPQGGELLL